MAEKPRIAIVGAGNLGSALAVSLRRAGYTIDSLIVRSRASLKKTEKLAKEVGARAVVGAASGIDVDVVWFCVSDSEIAHAAGALARQTKWKGKIALHSSGALTSAELAVLRQQGAAVASAHPLMTFVRGSRPSLVGVSFAVEGDRTAVRAVRRIVSDLHGQYYSIRKNDKAAYHAWGTFASPLFTSLVAVSEQVAAAAGVGRDAARRRMIPILLQTLANYASFGAAGAFSGPIVRGDVDTVKRHSQVLRRVPGARDVYLSLARAAVQNLPGKNQSAMKSTLRRKARPERRA